VIIKPWQAAALGATAVLMVFCGIAFTNSETPVTEYSSLAEARAAGALDRGWIPPSLPASATNLREVHDIDTNERWIAFTAPLPELRAMILQLAPLSYEAARKTVVDRPWNARQGWPPELSGPFWHRPRSTDLLSYYVSKEERYCFAIEWQTGRAWGWDCPHAG
jgi:hypothetical protein